MKSYEKPIFTTIELEDVITVSTPIPDIDNGSTQFPDSWLQS